MSHEKLGEIFMDLDDNLMKGISHEELQSFMNVVDKVYRNVERMKGENL